METNNNNNNNKQNNKNSSESPYLTLLNIIIVNIHREWQLTMSD